MINSDKPHLWKSDTTASVRMYNEWFLTSAPKAFRDTRAKVVTEVDHAFTMTSDLAAITPAVLRSNPGIIWTLRMVTSPPLARDRLVGLADAGDGNQSPIKTLVSRMEEGELPVRLRPPALTAYLDRICSVVTELLDVDLFPWLQPSPRPAGHDERLIAATVVADRMCGAQADPIVRNAQEQRQLAAIEAWLLGRGYVKEAHSSRLPLGRMPAGTFSFRQVVVVRTTTGTVNIPVDAVVQPHRPLSHGYPILIEAKSAGDFTNTNKRRKEEATKMAQLRATFGDDIGLILFLCGYFDGGYLGYEAAEGLDWVWEHRIDDLIQAGI
jgi:hypothetical protein